MEQPALRFQAYPDEDGWRWRTLLRNGRVSADSHVVYKTRRHAERAIEAFRVAAAETCCADG